jgi:hypothetical protein
MAVDQPNVSIFEDMFTNFATGRANLEMDRLLPVRDKRRFNSASTPTPTPTFEYAMARAAHLRTPIGIGHATLGRYFFAGGLVTRV